MALTAKQKVFVDEYLIDLNATQAAIRAGYSEKTAGQMGDENLKKPEIASEIQRRQKERQDRTEITQDMVLKGLAQVAFADQRRMFNEDGSFIPIHEMSDDSAMTLAGFEIETVSKGQGAVEHTAKVKTNDRMRALELLGKHMKMFTEVKESKVEHTGLDALFQSIDGKTKTIDSDTEKG